MKTSSSIAPSVARFQLLTRLQAAGTGAKLAQVLGDIAETMELSEVALRWPIAGAAQVHAVAGDSAQADGARWLPDISGRLAGARSAEEAFADPGNPRRLLIPLMVPGRRNGALSMVGREPVTEEEYFALVAITQALGRHPALAEMIGSANDDSRIAQRLGDAAVVAGKIAHDFDNIFTGVVGFAEMAQSLLTPGSLPHQYVTEIFSAGNRGIVFTAQLHQMSRCGSARPTPTSVSSVLAREEARLKKIPNLNVRLQFASPTDLPAVAIDGGAMQQVLGNILDNAVEASPPGGAIRVSAALIELSELEAREYLGAASAGPYVELRIADEGPGVREEHRKRLFVEPFFTTKVRHRGLGLPVSLRVLLAHRGGVRCDVPHRGSVFHVVLPLAAARAPDLGNAR